METVKRWGKGARYHDTDKGKEILLQVAIDCLIRNGVKSTTMQDVANAAHVSRRTVYRYFPHKEEMLREVFSYSRRLAFKTIREQAAPFIDDFFVYFREAVVAAVRFYLGLESGENTQLLDSDGNLRPQLYLNYDAAKARWKDILRVSYVRHITGPGGPDIERSVDHYAELANLLVAGHCQLRSSEEDIRQNFRYLTALTNRRKGHSALPPESRYAREA